MIMLAIMRYVFWYKALMLGLLNLIIYCILLIATKINKESLIDESYHNNSKDYQERRISMSELTLYEQETVLNYNRDEKVAYISTSNPFEIKEYLEMKEKFPDKVKITNQSEDVLCMTVPKRWVRVKPPKQMTEEQRLAAISRLNEAREKKEKNN